MKPIEKNRFVKKLVNQLTKEQEDASFFLKARILSKLRECSKEAAGDETKTCAFFCKENSLFSSEFDWSLFHYGTPENKEKGIKRVPGITENFIKEILPNVDLIFTAFKKVSSQGEVAAVTLQLGVLSKIGVYLNELSNEYDRKRLNLVEQTDEIKAELERLRHSKPGTLEKGKTETRSLEVGAWTILYSFEAVDTPIDTSGATYNITELSRKMRGPEIARRLVDVFNLVYDEDTLEYYWFDPLSELFRPRALDTQRELGHISQVLKKFPGVLQDCLNEPSKHSNLIKNMKLLCCNVGEQIKRPRNCVALGNVFIDFSDPENPEPKQYDPLKWFFTSKSPVNYDPSAKCPLWDIVRSQWVDTDADKIALNQILGYCLYTGNPFNAVFLIVGPPGTGKSSYLRTIRYILGEGNTRSISLYQLITDKWATNSLYGSLANISGEMKVTGKADLEMLLRISGGDHIPREEKFKSPLPAYKYDGKCIWSGNFTPRVPAENLDALAERIVMFRFEHNFRSNPDRDLFLTEKLRLEASGILNEALDCLKLLFVEEKLSGQRPAEETRAEFRKAGEPLYAFLEEACENMPGQWITKDGFFTALARYISKRKGGALTCPSKEWVGKNLELAADFVEDSNTTRAKAKVRIWRNIALKSEWAHLLPPGTSSLQKAEALHDRKAELEHELADIDRRIQEAPALADLRKKILEFLDVRTPTNLAALEINLHICCEALEPVLERMLFKGEIAEVRRGEYIKNEEVLK